MKNEKLAKVIACLALAFTMMISMAACGSEEGASSSSATVDTTATIQKETSTAATEAKETSGSKDRESSTSQEKAPSGFVLLSEAVPDVILEIRYYSTYNFVGRRIDGYEEPVAIMTEEGAKALKAASDEAIEKGYRLKIYDTYRPQTAVNDFADWAEDLSATKMKKYFYPDQDKSVLFDRGYIAYKSGHSRGSTVDLTLFDMTEEKEADMGGTFDFFGVESHPDYKKGLTDEQYENRMLLRKIMTDNGFEPLSTEWWHFTLGNEPYPNTYFDFPVAGSALE